MFLFLLFYLFYFLLTTSLLHYFTFNIENTSLVESIVDNTKTPEWRAESHCGVGEDRLSV